MPDPRVSRRMSRNSPSTGSKSRTLEEIIAAISAEEEEPSTFDDIMKVMRDAGKVSKEVGDVSSDVGQGIAAAEKIGDFLKPAPMSFPNVNLKTQGIGRLPDPSTAGLKAISARGSTSNDELIRMLMQALQGR